jgi:hypothetical protein
VIGLSQVVGVGLGNQLLGDREIGVVGLLVGSVKNGVELIHPPVHLLLEVDREKVFVEKNELLLVGDPAEVDVSGGEQHDGSAHMPFSTIVKELSQ